MAGLGRPPAPRAAMPAWKREILERKRAKLAALGAGPGAGAAPAGPAEQLVLAESLGPLRENPFMRLESERRRGARPAQQLLELYRRVPGVRTIRADNILIIEAAPGCPAPPAGPARIRAAEVLVYEAPPPAGRVSRLLEKFDPPAAPRRRGSPERARPPPPAPRAPPPPPPPAERAARLQPARPADGAGPGSRRGEFVQKTGSNSFTVHPRGLHRGAAPEPRPGPACAPAGAPPGPGEWKPKAGTAAPPAVPPPSPGTPSATAAARSPASATPSQRRWVSAATSANDSFEILPAPTPDLEAIPSGDLQARALASLRVNSRNSFVFVPKRKASEATAPPRDRQSAAWAQPGSGDAASALGRSPSEAAAVPWGASARPATTLTDGAAPGGGLPSPPPFLPAAAEAEPVQSDRAPGLAKNGREPGLPVTYIDEVDSEDEGPQEAKLPCPGAGAPPRHLPYPARPGHTAELQHRGGNTFVVVPKRKPAVLQEQPCGPANGQQQPREAEEPQREAGGLLGAVLKKRYPTVHEIEVIGGYLALQKSCLTKAGSSRKKMKISFNDKSLHTTFEYPSESSLAQDEEAEEEDGEDGDEDEDEEDEEEGPGPEKPFALFLPRATFVGSVGPERPGGSSGLSSYTPKHSVAFSRWQEQMLEQAVREAEPPPGEVTLTPASHDDLSDFRSEPALYF